MKRSLLVFGCLGAFACQEYEIKQTTNGANDLSDDGVPDIVVNPYVISFPDLDAAAGLEAQEIVIVTNQGEVDLLVDDIFVDDAAGRMEVVGEPNSILPVMSEVQSEVNRAGGPNPMISIERYAFYERAKKAYAVIQTGERRFYGCFAFRKGVIGPEEN